MIRVLVVDDHAVVRHGIKQILVDEEDIDVVGEAADGTEALRAVRGDHMNVVLLDMSLPGRSGIDLIKDLKRERPELKVLVLSMYNEEQFAVRTIRAGAHGYLTKTSAPEELVGAIRRVASGQVHLERAVMERLALSFAAPQHHAEPHTRLSDREYQVFLMLAAGTSVTAIAEQLFLSVKTVSTHKARILQKMGLANLGELIRYAVQHGLIDCATGDGR